MILGSKSPRYCDQSNVIKASILLFFLLLTVTAYGATPLDSARESTTTKHETTPPDIPYKRDDTITTSLIVRVVASLILALSIAVGVIYLLKRYLPGWRAGGLDRSGRISIIEIKRLNPKTLLFLIQVDGKTLLLAQSNDRVTALNLMENTAPVADIGLRTER